MKRLFRVLIISVFTIAAISLVVIQFVQTRRTFSISDNLFSVSVNNAMDEVIRQLEDESSSSDSPGSPISFQELDTLIAEELLVNGIDMHPIVGLYDGSLGSFLYSTSPSREDDLELSPYRYSFHPSGVVSANHYFILLLFPTNSILFRQNSTVFLYMSLFLLMVIVLMFIISLRMISNQSKLDLMKNEFISNMTHEIKTPISTISLACEMLSDEAVSQDNSSRSNFIKIIADENQRMRTLVETILQSSKMSNRNFHIDIQEVDLNQIVNKVAAGFKLTLTNRGGTLETFLDPSLPILAADELHLTNLLYNLVDNGIKYSTDHPHIIVRTSYAPGKVYISVSDSGIGISKADQKHIFEKFYRVPTGNVHNVKGFGIGLNYVSQVVRLHHGHISVESEPDQGTTFTVTLPA